MVTVTPYVEPPPSNSSLRDHYSQAFGKLFALFKAHVGHDHKYLFAAPSANVALCGNFFQQQRGNIGKHNIARGVAVGVVYLLKKSMSSSAAMYGKPLLTMPSRYPPIARRLKSPVSASSEAVSFSATFCRLEIVVYPEHLCAENQHYQHEYHHAEHAVRYEP